jgi:REP element-mobilizing transposase RayT
MTRSIRLEFPGALYHVTSRGDHSEAIFRDDADRSAWLYTLGAVCKRFNFVVHGFCQMTNHYHVLLETVEGNLAQGMRQLNGVYSQRFNRRHALVGHLFQGRYHAVLVQKEAYLLELVRYISLNPLRAGMVDSLADWCWSSHACIVGLAAVPCWLDTMWILTQFGSSPERALAAYQRFVLEGVGLASPLRHVRHHFLLCDDAFEARIRQTLPPDSAAVFSAELTRALRRVAALPLAAYQSEFSDRDEAMAHAYRSGAYSIANIARHFGFSDKTVSRAVARFEAPAGDKQSKDICPIGRRGTGG